MVARDVTRIPRWIELQAEIDLRLYLLDQMRSQLDDEAKRLTPLDRLIDQATGLDEARLAEAKVIMGELETLKAEWDTLTAPETTGP